MKAINIKWDTDGDLELLQELPKEIEIPKDMTDEDEISDYISDVTGFCHYGFDMEKERLIDKFAEQIFHTEESFLIEFEKGNYKKYCFFIPCKVGNNAQYVYVKNSCYSSSCYSDIREKPELVAIKSGEKVYIVNEYLLDLLREKILPQNIVIFSEFVEEKNEDIKSVIFEEFYRALNVCEIEVEDMVGCKKEARQILLSKNQCVESRKIEAMFTAQEIADSLCGMMDLEAEAKKRLSEDKNLWLKQKAYDVQLQKFVENQEGVEPYELKIADAIRSVEAKMLTVEFELNGKKATGKIPIHRLQRNLIACDYFSNYDFDTTKNGKQIFEVLNATDSKWDKSGKETISCKSISKITYGRRVLYER